MDLPRPFGQYSLLRRLAVGGMAEVYVGKARGLGGFEKLVAIKVIHPRYSEDPHFLDMLVDEAKLAVLLNHVNIAQVFDLGQHEHTYFIVMEFVEGADTSRLLARTRELSKKLPFDVCAHIAAEVCNGLDYAHRRRDSEGRPLGIVHRDISPQNVMVSFAGEVKVVDFGIAKAAQRSSETEVGVIKGKYYYMSPEQAWADPVDHRSDIFSTGVVLYELLTGEMLYQENNLPDLLAKVRKAEIDPPSSVRHGIPEELDAITMKALAARPEDRYQSAFDFGQALTQFVYGFNASFASGRMAALMAEAFSDELAKATATIRLPAAEQVLTSNMTTDGGGSTEEHSLPPMNADDFLPDSAKSVIFELEADERDHMTRRDIPPYRRRANLAATSDEARRQTGPVSIVESLPAVDEADEEEDRTIVQTGGPELWRSLGIGRPAARPKDDESDTSSPGFAPEPTVVDSTGDLARRVRESLSDKRTGRGVAPPPVARPSAPPPVARPSAPPPVARLSAPPPGVMPPPAPMPTPRPAATLPWGGAPVHHSPPPPPGPAPPGSIPAADPFAPPSFPGMDPFGPPPPLSAEPLPAVANFSAASAMVANLRRRWRWVLGLVVVVTVLAFAFGALLSPGSPEATLSIRSTPAGARVQLDGHALPGLTPLASVPVEVGHSYHLRVEAQGYRPTEVVFTARAGSQGQTVSLQRPRVRLRVEASTAELRVSINGSEPQPPPVEIPGLLPGSSVRILVSGPGDAPERELSHVVSTDDPNVLNVDPPPSAAVPEPAPPPGRPPRRPAPRRPHIFRLPRH